MSEALVTLILSTALLLGSPGPAPLALAANGVSVGFKKGLPFLSGILSALAIVIIVCASGLGALLLNFPMLKTAGHIIASLYLCVIAYKVATNRSFFNHNATPLGFKDGLLLNLLNPKAYAAFLTLFSQFNLPFEDAWLGLAITGLICFIVAVIVDTCWLAMGKGLASSLTDPSYLIKVRWLCALLLGGIALFTLGSAF